MNEPIATSTPTVSLPIGRAVHLVQRRGEINVYIAALVTSMSMADVYRGSKGEMAIEAVFVNPLSATRHAGTSDWQLGLIRVMDVPHVSHDDFVSGRVAYGYEELPAAQIYADEEKTDADAAAEADAKAKADADAAEEADAKAKADADAAEVEAKAKADADAAATAEAAKPKPAEEAPAANAGQEPVAEKPV
jgi:hypothetical protein